MPANRVTSRNPWHVVFVLDDSGSMQNGPAASVNEALRATLDELEILSAGSKPYFKISIVVFGSHAEVLAEAESEQAIDATAIAVLQGSRGTTDAAGALDVALDLLRRNPGSSTDFTPYVFFMSDGAPNDRNAALQAGDRLKGLDIDAGSPHIVTVGFGQTDDDFMRKLAHNPEMYKKLKTPQELTALFPNIGTIASVTAQGGTAAIDQAIMDL